MNKLELFLIGAIDAVSAAMVIVILLTILAIYHVAPF